MIRLLCALAFFFLAGTASFAEPPSSVLYIYATKPSGYDTGSAFLVSTSGTFVTAYHVIKDSTKIQVIDVRNNSYSNPKVLYLDTLNDIAVLSLNTSQTAAFRVVDLIPQAGTSFTLVGHPWGFKNQTLTARATQTGLANSAQLRGPHGFLFARGIPIIPLDVTIYGGMSGAPVIDQKGQVVGLLTGSFNEGGGIAWAVPGRTILAALSKLPARGRDLRDVSWPPMVGYSTNFRGFSQPRSLGAAETVSWMQALWKERGAVEIQAEGFSAHITRTSITFDSDDHVLTFTSSYDYLGQPFRTTAAVDILDAARALAPVGSSGVQPIIVECGQGRACATVKRQRLGGGTWHDLDNRTTTRASTAMWALKDTDAASRGAMAINHLIRIYGAPVAKESPFDDR